MDHATASRRRSLSGAGLSIGAAFVLGADAEAATVSNVNPSGPGSLALAVDDTNASPGDDTITFNSSLSGTINLAATLVVTDTAVIQGPSSRNVIVNAPASNGFSFTPAAANSSISDLKVQGGNFLIRTDADMSILRSTVSGANSYGLRVSNGAEVYIGYSGFNGNLVGVSVTASGQASLFGSTVGGSALSGILLDDATLNLSYSSVANNPGRGIDMYTFNDYSFVNLFQASVSGNGNAGIETEGNLELDYSTVAGNSGTTGGGIEIDGGFVDIATSTVSGNTASVAGGGVNVANSYLDVTASTFSGNSAPAGMGGAIFDSTAGNTNELGSSIFANSSAGAFDLAGPGTFIIADSLVESPGSVAVPGPTNLTGIDPQLGNLAVNGGQALNQTLTHRPAVGSPVLDRGNSDPINDQRFKTRPVDLAGVPNVAGSDNSDIGSVELTQAENIPPPAVAPAGPSTPSNPVTPAKKCGKKSAGTSAKKKRKKKGCGKKKKKKK